MIGSLIDEENPYWDNYLSHAEIMDEIFAPVYHEDRIDYLRMIIEDFRYIQTDRLLPKCTTWCTFQPGLIGILIHINDTCTISFFVCFRCGPLIRMWCMRYEAKHSFLNVS